MKQLQGRHIHFVGIGGAGMAPLAEICLARGAFVSGSDLVHNSKTAHLISSGARIAPPGHAAENVPVETDLLVYSSAVKETNPELLQAQKWQLSMLRRGELLGEIGFQYHRPVAVSGAHGKTSITSLLSWIARKAIPGSGYMIGGMLNGDIPPAAAGNGDVFITEVDESDGTHTCFHAAIGIVSNMDDDHAWSLGGVEVLHRNFQTFAGQAKKLIFLESPLTVKMFSGHADALILREKDCEILLETLGLQRQFQGFQAWNAALAITAAVELGISAKEAALALQDFPGVARRMTVRKTFETGILLEDYAHHPVELAASLKWMRLHYPDAHLRILFQPHRFARLERYFDEFVSILKEGCDSCLIVPVFAAWTESGPVDSDKLAAAIGPKAEAIPADWKLAAEKLLACPEQPWVAAVIGAGDLEKVFPYLL